MALNGALAGLVAITAGPDTPSALVATLIGAVGGLIVVVSIVWLDRELRIDDPVGAISVHGEVGLCGLLEAPLTTSSACLLYLSDAADEADCVAQGARRIYQQQNNDGRITPRELQLQKINTHIHV